MLSLLVLYIIFSHSFSFGFNLIVQIFHISLDCYQYKYLWSINIFIALLKKIKNVNDEVMGIVCKSGSILILIRSQDANRNK